jgi:hypothetical protein
MVISTEPGVDLEGHTLAVDPQERARGFPFGKYSATKEPLSGSIVLNAACDAVIH